MSEQPKISDEAIEAAMDAAFPGLPMTWVDAIRRVRAGLEAAYPLLRNQWEAEADSHPTACGCPAEWVLCISHNMKTCGEVPDAHS